MTSQRPPHRRWPGGLVGTYALAMMSRAPIYGGELAQRIEDLTRGAWRPGAGAIYPSLRGLVSRGEARIGRQDGRKVYILTARGAARLNDLRNRIRERGSRFAELRNLILDMVEPSDRAAIMLDQLHQSIRGFEEMYRSPDSIPDARARARTLARARAELRQGLARLGPPKGHRSSRD